MYVANPNKKRYGHSTTENRPVVGIELMLLNPRTMRALPLHHNGG